MNQKQTRFGASVAVFSGEEVLLVLRGKEPMKGFWSLPGGAVEPDEAPIETAKRELLEETQLVAGDLLPVTEFHPHRLKDGVLVESDIIIYVFTTTKFSGTAVASDDAADLRWVNWQTLDQLKTTPNADEIIKLARSVAFTEV